MDARCGVAATFFIAMGPDNSGRAILWVFNNPGLLPRCGGGLRIFDVRYGAPCCGAAYTGAADRARVSAGRRETKEMGFELGVHGYDHVLWQDHLDDLGKSAIGRGSSRLSQVCRAITGIPARSFAAPGWRTNTQAIRFDRRDGIDSRSDTRGDAPYRCWADGQVLATPEIRQDVADAGRGDGRPEPEYPG